MREPQKVHGQRTGWFGTNYGEPYNTRMLTDSTPLERMPRVLHSILERMLDTVEEVLGERPSFHELLTIGNYPKMSMGWHNDGGATVRGGIVASTSVGGHATMKFGPNNVYLIDKRASHQIRP
ncbi:Uu.00g033820.m01.CDS01 [Anthostomella pinea]|uniref:Uu.00g033820.m01.CDS01 n=1 Tax=Anthostomella pinea TaxID=933095 RepID=A0AAI8V8T0_9PEZI|nr:Uu.00g033820.m01.CDS01 [Anthostomella pinea]